MVIAFHGQGARGSRLKEDMGCPSWVDWYPDWQRDYRGAKHFSSVCIDRGLRNLVLIGYSLGGDFIARLTWEQVSDFVSCIIVYESPLKHVEHPRPIGCPVMVIWNNYKPRTSRRRQEKADVIASWNMRFLNTENIIASLGSHMVKSRRRPFLRHAWDRSLNPRIEEWVKDAVAAY